MGKKNDKQNRLPDEIDIIKIIGLIWGERIWVLRTLILVVLIGIIISLTTTPQYLATARLLPESKESTGGASQLLRQFGGLGNIGMPGEGSDAIRPDLYPEVLRSTPFYLELLQNDLHWTEKGEDYHTNVFTYMEKHGGGGFSLAAFIRKYTVRLPYTVKGWFKKPIQETIQDNLAIATNNKQEKLSITQMTIQQYYALRVLQSRIDAEIDHRTGIILVSAQFPNPQIAAQVAQFAIDYLSEYIITYRIEKAQADLAFVKTRYEERKKDFHQAQLNLARFRDANQNIVSAAVQTEEQRLQDQYNISFNVYNSLAQQMEQTRLKVQENTPVIKVLEPVVVPVQRFKPKRVQMLIISILLGGVLGVALVLIKLIVAKFKD